MSLSTEAVWHSLGHSLRGFIQSRVGDPHLAEDLLQDVFLKIHENIGSLREEDRVAAWVYRMTRNAVADHFRRNRTQETPVEDIAAPDAEPGEAFRRELTASVRAIIAGLPPKYAEALELVEIQGMSQKDLADHLGLSVSGAKSRIQRGRELVRGELLACCHLDFDQRGRPTDWTPRRDCNTCCPSS